jgi:hypothetical protein
MSNDVSDVRAVSTIIVLMMEAARTSETSVDINLITRKYIPEDSELQKHVLLDLPVRMNYSNECLLPFGSEPFVIPPAVQECKG